MTSLFRGVAKQPISRVWAIAFCLTSLAKRFGAALSAVAAVAFLVAPAFADAPAEKRVALVIGNGAYRNAPKLDNAAFDARAVADAFRKLGFQVVDGYDLDVEQMRAKVSEFSADLPDAKSAVVYYAGHGISVDDENYLIPTDIVLKSPTDLDLGAISVSLILKQMKREDRVNIVVLDACRDNPFASALAKNKTRAIIGERGLSRIDGDLARGTLIAFASDPKSTALDGPPGQHSPFTEAFLDHVFDPGVSIDTVMSRVRSEVWEKTHHGQLPWVNTSLIGDYALNRGICIGTEGECPTPKAPVQVGAAAAAAPSANGAAAGQSQEDLLWESAQHSNMRADYQAYLDAYPNGFFARMAKNRIASLETPAALPSDKETPAAPAPSEKDWKAEIGTADTEKALDLAPADQKEIQQRLTALNLYKGPATGALDPATRLALTEWQKQQGVAPTSFLGSIQLAALRAQSEDAYRKLLAAEPAPAPRAKEAAQPAREARPRQLEQPAREPRARQAVQPATRAATWAAREPVRRPEPARRASRRRPATETAAAPATPAGCTGSPEWCAKAGLPVSGDAPQTSRPPEFLGGFTAGAATGLIIGRFRH